MRYFLFLLLPVMCFGQDSTKVSTKDYNKLLGEHKAYRTEIIKPLLNGDTETNVANLSILYSRLQEENQKLKSVLEPMRQMGLGLEQCKTMAQVDSVLNIYGLRRNNVTDSNKGSSKVQAPKSNNP